MITEKQRLTFISYSRTDGDFALALAKELRSSGFLVWLDQLDIPTGSRWDDEVERALENCEIFMVILTPNSIKSNNVKDEIGYAIDSNKHILPILLENAKVPFRLRRFQYVDFTKFSHDEGVESAKQLLSKLVKESTNRKQMVPVVLPKQTSQVKPDRDKEKTRIKLESKNVYTKSSSNNKKTGSFLVGIILLGIIITGTLKLIKASSGITVTPFTPTLATTYATATNEMPANTPPTPNATITPKPVREEIIGLSANNTEIVAYRFGNGPRRFVFIGGLHAGFAPSTVFMAQRLKEYLIGNPDYITKDITIDVITIANPDSLPPLGHDYSGSIEGRLNSSQVDLNRNWDCDWRSKAVWRNTEVSGGSAPFSEPETLALKNFIVGNEKPVAVVFWLAKDNPPSVSPGGCGSSSNYSNPLAQFYSGAAGYKAKVFEAYAVYGDATNWLDSQGIASISVLLPSYTDLDSSEFNANLDAIKQIVIFYGN